MIRLITILALLNVVASTTPNVTVSMDSVPNLPHEYPYSDFPVHSDDLDQDKSVRINLFLKFRSASIKMFLSVGNCVRATQNPATM